MFLCILLLSLLKRGLDVEVETSAALLASPHQVVNVNVVCPQFKER